MTAERPGRVRWYRQRRYYVAAVLLTWCGWRVYAITGLFGLFSSRVPTISRETTFVDGPLTDSGYVDYTKALNIACRGNLRSEDNAYATFLNITGLPDLEFDRQRQYLEQLRLVAPVDPTKRLNNYFDYRKSVSRDMAHGPDTNQSYRQLTQACSAPFTREELPEIAAWLESQRPLVRTFLKASRQQHYFDPVIPWHVHGLAFGALPSVRFVSDISSWINAEAMLAIGEGRSIEAAELSLALHRFARLQAQCPGVFTLRYASFITSTAVQHTDSGLLQAGRLSVDQWREQRQLRRQLQPLRTLAHTFDRTIRYERLAAATEFFRTGFLLSAEDDAAEFVPARLGIVDLDVVLRVINDFTDGQVEILNERSEQNVQLRMKQLRNESRVLNESTILSLLFWDSRATWNRRFAEAICLKEHGSSLPSIASALRTKTWMTLCDVGFAVRIFRETNGQYPDSLDQLVPELLKRQPVDQLSGTPLLYFTTDGGFQLYAVGPNGRNDGARFDPSNGWDDMLLFRAVDK
jgi:hypothetical protein